MSFQRARLLATVYNVLVRKYITVGTKISLTCSEQVERAALSFGGMLDADGAVNEQGLTKMFRSFGKAQRA